MFVVRVIAIVIALRINAVLFLFFFFVAIGCDVVFTVFLVFLITAEVFFCFVIMVFCYESYCNVRKSVSLLALSAILMFC